MRCYWPLFGPLLEDWVLLAFVWTFVGGLGATGLCLDLCWRTRCYWPLFGLSSCTSHVCQHCRAQVEHLGLHGLSCKKSQEQHFRHVAVNDTIKRSLGAAKIPQLEPPPLADLMVSVLIELPLADLMVSDLIEPP